MIFKFYINNKYNGDWGMGDWGLGPIPNPQSPIPNPQSPFSKIIFLYFKYIYLIIFAKKGFIHKKIINLNHI